MKIRTLLIEDDLSLATTVATYLGLDGIECDHASNGKAGLELVRRDSYHAVLLDINLPRMDGLDVCEALRRRGIDIPILMLTGRDTLEDKLAGFNAGTDDYLVKPFQMKELTARVRALANRRSAKARKLSLGDLDLDLSTRTATRAGRTLALTPTGWTILETLLRNTPDVVSRNDLEQAIWDDREPPDTDALKVHLYRLRQQVDKPFSKALIRTVANFGVAIRVPDE